jgi:VWFA-related protein
LPRLKSLSALLAGAAFFLTIDTASPMRAHAQSDTPAAPQLIPRTAEEREQRYIANHRILLSVRVFDAAGNPSSDLDASDFTVLDNHKPRKLVRFQLIRGASAIAPVRIVFVLDAVNNTSRQLRDFEKQIEKYLRQQKDQLTNPTSIGVFSGSSIDMEEPALDRNTLLDGLRSLASHLHATGCLENEQQGEPPPPAWLAGSGNLHGLAPGALNCMNQRFITSVSALYTLASHQANVAGPLLVLWIGSGWPILTNREFRSDTSDIRQNFFAQLVGVSTALREAQITLDAVASPNFSPDSASPDSRNDAFYAGVSDQNSARAGNLGLHALAHQTGGRILRSTHDIDLQLRTCIADAASYYLLAFDSPPATQYGEYHSLEVKVDRPGWTARTNTLYYAEQ